MRNAGMLNPWRVSGWALALALLLAPAVAMQLTSEVNWTGSDFIIAGTLLGLTGIGIEAALRVFRRRTARVAAVLFIATAFFITWLELAVGVLDRLLGT